MTGKRGVRDAGDGGQLGGELIGAFDIAGEGARGFPDVKRRGGRIDRACEIGQQRIIPLPVPIDLGTRQETETAPFRRCEAELLRLGVIGQFARRAADA